MYKRCARCSQWSGKTGSDSGYVPKGGPVGNVVFSVWLFLIRILEVGISRSVFFGFVRPFVFPSVRPSVGSASVCSLLLIGLSVGPFRLLFSSILSSVGPLRRTGSVSSDRLCLSVGTVRFRLVPFRVYCFVPRFILSAGWTIRTFLSGIPTRAARARLRVLRSEGFQELPFPLVQDFVREGELQADEADLFAAVRSWVDRNPAERRRYVDEVRVRYGL